MAVEEAREEVILQFAFVGKMASGKGTYTEYFKEAINRELGADLSLYVFSTKIISIAKEHFGMEKRDRKLMSSVANKMREIDSSVWANYVVWEIKNDKKSQFIIDGIRVVAEADTLKNNFPEMTIIKLETNEKDRMEAYRNKHGMYPDESELNNKSETEIDSIPFDVAIFNVYDMEMMKRQVDEIVELIKSSNTERLKGLKVGFH